MPDTIWRCVVGDEDAWSIQGHGLSLRPPARPEDAEALYDCRRTVESQKYVGTIVGSTDEMREIITRQRGEERAVRCAIERDGRVVGDIGGRFERPGSLIGEPEVWNFHLGYCIHPAVSGQGLAGTAVSLVVPLLHETFGVHRIVAMVFEEHRASIRVLTRQGFRLEGTQVAAVLGRDGHWWNDCMFAHLG